MSLKALETLVADRLDKKLLVDAALAAQDPGHKLKAERRWNELMSFEINGLCLALRALYAEEGVDDPEHFPQPQFISEEWRSKHRSLML